MRELDRVNGALLTAVMKFCPIPTSVRSMTNTERPDLNRAEVAVAWTLRICSLNCSAAEAVASLVVVVVVS